MIILNKKALAKKYLIMILEALKLNIITFIALAYNGSGIAEGGKQKARIPQYMSCRFWQYHVSGS